MARPELQVLPSACLGAFLQSDDDDDDAEHKPLTMIMVVMMMIRGMRVRCCLNLEAGIQRRNPPGRHSLLGRLEIMLMRMRIPSRMITRIPSTVNLKHQLNLSLKL